MRVKAKTWGVTGKKNNQTPHSQLQTVLITASGPQASNALVHRERYTQGSRQNRCVSSQEALALRAKAKGTEVDSVLSAAGRSASVLYAGSPRVQTTGDRLLSVKATASRRGCFCIPRLPLAPDRRLMRHARDHARPPGPHGPSAWRGLGQKIANSELLTAGNPTV